MSDGWIYGEALQVAERFVEEVRAAGAGDGGDSGGAAGVLAGVFAGVAGALVEGDALRWLGYELARFHKGGV